MLALNAVSSEHKGSLHYLGVWTGIRPVPLSTTTSFQFFPEFPGRATRVALEVCSRIRPVCRLREKMEVLLPECLALQVQNSLFILPSAYSNIDRNKTSTAIIAHLFPIFPGDPQNDYPGSTQSLLPDMSCVRFAGRKGGALPECLAAYV